MTKIEVQQIVYEMLKNMLSGLKGDKGDPGVCKCVDAEGDKLYNNQEVYELGYKEGRLQGLEVNTEDSFCEGHYEGYNKGWLAAFDEVTDDYWHDMIWHDEPEEDEEDTIITFEEFLLEIIMEDWD